MKRYTEIVWPDGLKEKMDALVKDLRGMESALVAFSGGVDSTFLSLMAHQVLGPKALAVTATSPTFPQREVQEAVKLARQIGIRHQLIESNELEIPGYTENPPDRCYHCKAALFALLIGLAKKEGLRVVMDGANADDLQDYRPGRRATQELGVRSPLLDTGFGKADIREASRLLGLPTAEKPSYACLASRFPYGTRITANGLNAVEQAENGLRDMGFGQVRVRAHGEIARLELSAGDIVQAATDPVRDKIIQLIKTCGFKYVALDLQGYRTGSMNETLKKS